MGTDQHWSSGALATALFFNQGAKNKTPDALAAGMFDGAKRENLRLRD
jgi:hypothetical protein